MICATGFADETFQFHCSQQGLCLVCRQREVRTNIVTCLRGGEQREHVLFVLRGVGWRAVVTIIRLLFVAAWQSQHLANGVGVSCRDGAVPATDADAIREMLGLPRRDEQQTNDSNDGAPAYPSENEQHVLSLLTTPQARDDICAHLALPTHETQALLAAMELKGLICESGGAYHRLR